MRVTLLSVAVGAFVTAASTGAGVDVCSRAPGGQPDQVCYQLVRTLAQREGIAAAAATAIVVLMMVGLSRLARGPDPTRPDRTSR